LASEAIPGPDLFLLLSLIASRMRQRFMRAILIILSAARLDRDFDFVVTGPLDGEQDASIGLVRDQP
jgi:hypothetical protein